MQMTVTERVGSIYEDIGRSIAGGVTNDAASFEDLRPAAAAYVSACRRRTLAHLPLAGQRILDMASGPIQYPEYLEYSAGFATRVCVDLSRRALDMAKAKIGEHGEYLHGDFLDLDVAPVDAAISLHTIYHIDQRRQEAAVRKLIAVTRPGGTIVIVYSNPDNIVSAIKSRLQRLTSGVRRPAAAAGQMPDTLYFQPFPLAWWQRFTDAGRVTIYPWRTFSSRVQQSLIPGNRFGEWLLARLFSAEARFPRFFARIGCYPMIVIRKI